MSESRFKSSNTGTATFVVPAAIICCVVFAFGLSGCSAGSGGGSNDAATAVPLTFVNAGSDLFAGKGIYDPSLESDSNDGVWLAFSEINDSPTWSGQNDSIQTRLAYSSDSGATWSLSPVHVNLSEDVALPFDPPLNAGTWNHEVPALAYDALAPVNERWKMFWHRYLWVNGSRAFDHGWIALKSAPAPDGPWSDERKLFVGSLYNSVDDAIIGPPEVRLDQLHPDLSSCLAFTEPGVLATDDGLYVALAAVESASDPTSGRVLLLKCPHAGGAWEYVGTLLNNPTDAPPFGCDGFTAPELFSVNGRNYMLVVPRNNYSYQGTYLFEVEDMNSATVKRAGGVPELLLELHGNTSEATGQHGAAAYTYRSRACGILYSEVLYSDMIFRIYMSRVNP